VVLNRPLVRDKFMPWCAQLPAGALNAMEANSSAHHWARKLVALGLDARIIAAHRVAPYRLQGKSGKNAANDAVAICEGASNELGGLARLALQRAQSQWLELDATCFSATNA
jgi:transposase